jgi:hypothetical protein
MVFLLDIVFYCIIGLFGLKLVLFDFPIFANARSWPNYFKKISIIVSVLLLWFGFGHLSESYPMSTFALILFLSIALFAFMAVSKNKEED